MISAADKIKSTLAAHLPGLQKKYFVDRLALFGSVTRSDFDAEKSDVDVLIEFSKTDLDAYLNLAEELEKILGKKVDLITKDSLKPRHWEYLKDKLVYV